MTPFTSINKERRPGGRTRANPPDAFSTGSGVFVAGTASGRPAFGEFGDFSLLESRYAPSVTVGVIGLGYVGLPMALSFAEAGERVVAIDVDEAKVAALDAGVSYISQ